MLRALDKELVADTLGLLLKHQEDKIDVANRLDGLLASPAKG